MVFFEQLSKRERLIFIGTAIAIVLLILDQFAYNPLCDSLAGAQAARDKCREDLRGIHSNMEKQTQLAPKWRQMLQSGLKSDPEEAESQVLHALHQWAQDCRVKLTMLRSDRGQESASNSPSKKRLPEIAFHATGEGNLESLARLLWRMQSATMPIRVTKVQVNTPKEGIDNLSFQMDLSTIYAPSPRSQSQPAAAPASGPASATSAASSGTGVPPVSSSRRTREEAEGTHGRDAHDTNTNATDAHATETHATETHAATQPTSSTGGQ